MTTDLKSQVRDYTQYFASTVAPVEVPPSPRLSPPPMRRRYPAWAYAIGTAVLVLLVIGGIALLVQRQDSTPPVVTQPDHPVTTTIPPTVPVDSLPGASLTKVVETSIGSWTWARHDADVATLDQDYAMPNMTVVPVPGAPLPEVAGLTWIQLDESSHSADASGVTVVAMPVAGFLDESTLYDAPVQTIWDWQSMTLDVLPDGGALGERIGLLQVTVVAGDPEAVEFRDLDTAEVVLRMETNDPSVSAQDLAAEHPWDYWLPEIWRLYVDSGTDALWVEPPWLGLPVDNVDVVSTNDGFVVIATVRPPWGETDRSSLVYTWGSANGTTWNQLGQPFTTGRMVQNLAVVSDGDRLVLIAIAADGGDAAMWTSTDGSDWEQIDADFGPGLLWWDTGLARTSTGWVLAWTGSSQEGFCEVWISSDGQSWEQVAYSPMITVTGDGGTSACWVQDDSVVARVDDFAQGSVWIGQLGG